MLELLSQFIFKLRAEEKLKMKVVNEHTKRGGIEIFGNFI